MNGTWKTVNVVIGDVDEGPPEPADGAAVVAISPVVHYEMGQLPGHDCDGDASCIRSTTFRWRGEDTCRGKFVCCTLENNVCGSYGINVTKLTSGS